VSDGLITDDDGTLDDRFEPERWRTQWLLLL